MEVKSNEIVNGISAIMPGQIWFFEIGDRSPVCTMTKNRPHLILSTNSREIVCLPLTHQNSANSNWKVPVINSDKGTKSYILASRPVTLYIDDIRSRMRYYTSLSPKLFQKVVATFMAAMFGAYYGDDIVRVANEALDIFNAKNEYDYMAFMPYDYYSIDGVMSKINAPTTAPVEIKESEPETNTDEFKNKLIDSLREISDLINLNKVVKSTKEATKESESEPETNTDVVFDTTKPQQVKSAESPKDETKSTSSQINLDEYVSMTQAINEFGLTRGAAEYMGRNIDGIKIGKRRLMKRSDCEAFLANKKKHKPHAKRNASASDVKLSTATTVVEDTETDERVQPEPIKIKNRKEFIKGMLIPVCELDKKTSTSVYEIANTFKTVTGNEMSWTEAKGIMNNLCIENHDIKHRDFSSTEFSVKLTTHITEGQKKLKVEQIIRDIRNYGEDVAKRKWNIDDNFIESNCKETACK